jgi:hypothetical protein
MLDNSASVMLGLLSKMALMWSRVDCAVLLVMLFSSIRDCVRYGVQCIDGTIACLVPDAKDIYWNIDLDQE